MQTNDTAERLLDRAQELIQNRGYNAFSYRDLAEDIGIKTASIHYHFPSKQDLGAALMQRYHGELNLALGRIDQSGQTQLQKIKGFIKLYSVTEKHHAICLCGSLAADRETLPQALQEAVDSYLQRSEEWVAEQIRKGLASGEFKTKTDPRDLGAALVSGLQGGLIVARARNRPMLQIVQRVFLQGLMGA
jgi:TetR/AcrR family transcriptional repressor of nem operon